MKLQLLKNSLLAGASVLLVQPAFAGSLAEPIVETAVVAPQAAAVTDWSGAYAGGTLGGVSGSSLFCEDGYDDTCEGNPSDRDLPMPAPEGTIFGLTAGYNWQRGNLVYGVEADISKASAEGGAESTIDYGCGIGECRTDILAAATLRGRVGYATGQWLPYATAGVGALEVEVGFPEFDPATMNTARVTTPVAGLGVEYMMNSGLSLKAEALYFFESEELVEAANDPCGDPCGATAIDATIVRFGVNYHF
ncbi:outer membrane immunogenic protein [Yoonia tamlensis]|uniref:Outer membrane immunogenic protein n=1 Tax=Yoonia tamlensis TaxID=390270 RepID=A0A1I6G553_9RHOB|nr:outer membrane beta-barrel protein [Yoonia tamlensis]SFR37325.1 outer membrane immunogenic protein [Yoonia tamlensis]